MKKKFSKPNSLLLLSLVIAIPSLVFGQQVIVGTGTGLSALSPLGRTVDYGVCEIIYLATEINTSGAINQLAFDRVSGTDISPIDSVTIYMQHTSLSAFTTSNYSASGYTLVYSGTFPNDTGTGWREVVLNTPFAYNGTDNLDVLVVKGYQAANTGSGFPLWYYTDLSPLTRVRRYTGNIPISASTLLSTTTFRSNVRLDFGPVGVVEIIPDVVSVYPNPSKGKINFRFDSDVHDRNLQVKVYNLFGESAYQNIVQSGEEISLNTLTPGIYFYAISSVGNKIMKTGKLSIIN